MRQAVLSVADQRDYMSAMAGDQTNWRTCFSVYACDAEPDEDDGGVLSGPRDWDRAKRLVAEAGYKGERIVVIDPADIAQLHAEALVTEQLLKKLGLNVELATSEWGTAIKRINVKDPVEQGGWSVFGTAYASYDLLNPATNRNLRAGRNRRAARLGERRDDRGPAQGLVRRRRRGAAPRPRRPNPAPRFRNRALYADRTIHCPSRLPQIACWHPRIADPGALEHREAANAVSQINPRSLARIRIPPGAGLNDWRVPLNRRRGVQDPPPRPTGVIEGRN